MWLIDISIYLVVVLLAFFSITRNFNSHTLPGYDWLVTTIAIVLLILGISWGFALLVHLRKSLNKE